MSRKSNNTIELHYADEDSEVLGWDESMKSLCHHRLRPISASIHIRTVKFTTEIVADRITEDLLNIFDGDYEPMFYIYHRGIQLCSFSLDDFCKAENKIDVFK